MSGRGATRRQAVLAGGIAMAGIGTPLAALAAVDKALQKKLQRAALGGSIHIEQAKMVALEAIANGRLLGPRETTTIRVLQDHANEHAALLAMLSKGDLGVEPPLAPDRSAIPGLRSLRSAHASIRLGIDLERRAIGAHLRTLRVLRDAPLLRAIPQVLASDGQHLVLLRQLLGEDAVPSAFERGTV
ncbi:MAG: hypothetical protein JOZ25_06810 [Actinobacteria bacterium]|nr:hypothetical protein [Actinomycetota bacterium]